MEMIEITRKDIEDYDGNMNDEELDEKDEQIARVNNFFHVDYLKVIIENM